VTELGLINPGDEVQFKIEVTNLGGYTNTSHKSLKVIVADVPDTPTSSPVCDFANTDTTKITIEY
jgi:hypothetical protein